LIDEDQTLTFEDKEAEKEGKRVISRKQNMNSITIWVRPKTTNEMRIYYSFKPKRKIITVPKLIMGLLSYFSAQMLFLKYCSMSPDCATIPPQNVLKLLDKTPEIAIGIIGASIVIAGLIANTEIRDLLKYWFIIPIVLALTLLL